MAPIQPEILSREIVKPSSSITPNNHPKIHNLSFFDQVSPPVYIPLLIFYTRKRGETEHQISSLLKSSLSSILSHYYPLAGKLKDNFTVDCNDDGALFLEARMKCKLSLLLNNPQDELLRHLLPDNLALKNSVRTGPLVIQVTYFTCGGMSIGVCACHKIVDMSSLCNFVNDWASLARNSGREIRPDFNIASLYPAVDTPSMRRLQEVAYETKECLTRRRFVFDAEKIAKLKETVADHVPNPTRAEVLAALLCKSAIKAAAKASSSGSIKPSVMTNALNFRSVPSSSLSERNIGIMGWIFHVKIREDRQVELGYLVKEFRKSKSQLINSFTNTSNREELYSMLLKGFNVEGDFEMFLCSNCSSFPFYEVDFGWGKPLWIYLNNVKNQMIFCNIKEGNGIEALVCLEEKVMAVFEEDEELLSFCSINPSVLVLESCL